MGSAVQYYRVLPGKPLQRMAGLAEVLSSGEGYAWIDHEDPTAEQLAALIEPLGIHPVAIEDCLDEDQVPKIEDFPGHTFILFNRYRYADGLAVVDEVNFFLGERFLVTVHSHGQGNRAFGERLESMVQHEMEMAARGPDYLLQVILDHIVDEKFAAIEALEDDLDALEEEVLREVAAFRPEKLTRLRRNLLFIRKSLVYEREILVRICRRDSPFVSEGAIFQFRDIYDHLAKFFEVIEICRDLISTLMEIHLAMINNHMAMVGNKTNYAVRRLTLITTIFMPLTLLAGIGGMSEWSMMTGPQNWRLAYPAFLVLMVVIGAGSYSLLRWLDGRDRSAAALQLTAPPAGRDRGSS